jgi:hypothetical protein
LLKNDGSIVMQVVKVWSRPSAQAKLNRTFRRHRLLTIKSYLSANAVRRPPGRRHRSLLNNNRRFAMASIKVLT